MREIIWLGASVTIREQPKGMPRQGEVHAINGNDITVKRWLTKAQEEEGLIEGFGIYDRSLLSVHTPNAIEVDRPDKKAPLVIEEPHVELSSLVSIQKYDRWDNSPTPDLVIVNGEVQFGLQNKDSVVAQHSFARDEEGDQSYVFTSDFEMVKFDKSFDGQVRWVGMMMEAKFFDPNKDTPWKRAVEQDDSGRDNYAANYGYPYQGPQARVKGLQTPAPVRVTLWTGTPKHLETVLHWMVGLEDHS